MTDASLRPRSHGTRSRAAESRRVRPVVARPVPARDVVKRRRANVLFVLVLVAFCTLFLAATTKTDALYYVFGAAFVALCGYVYVLGQRRQRELAVERSCRSRSGWIADPPISARTIDPRRCAGPPSPSGRRAVGASRRGPRCTASLTAGRTPSERRIRPGSLDGHR